MTREEQIIEASHLYAKAQQKPFMDGAKWADENPKSKYNLSDVDYITETLKSIVELAEQTTSGNVAHKIATIKFQANMALKCINEL